MCHLHMIKRWTPRVGRYAAFVTLFFENLVHIHLRKKSGQPDLSEKKPEYAEASVESLLESQRCRSPYAEAKISVITVGYF